jgi:hypothetical protein
LSILRRRALSFRHAAGVPGRSREVTGARQGEFDNVAGPIDACRVDGNAQRPIDHQLR